MNALFVLVMIVTASTLETPVRLQASEEFESRASCETAGRQSYARIEKAVQSENLQMSVRWQCEYVL